MQRDRAVSMIIAYKLGKGALWFLFALLILGSMRLGLEDHLLGLAAHLRHHSHAWSLDLAELVVRAASRRGLWIVVVALIADGGLSLLEGWALVHGKWWGPWLVVVATGCPLPFEVVALVRRPHPVRAVLLVVNLAIVVYLGQKALREHRERVAHQVR